MFEKHIACCLLWIDAYSIVCNDSARLRRHSELFGGKLQDGCKRSILWNAKDPKWELGIRSKNYLECDFGLGCAWSGPANTETGANGDQISDGWTRMCMVLGLIVTISYDVHVVGIL